MRRRTLCPGAAALTTTTLRITGPSLSRLRAAAVRFIQRVTLTPAAGKGGEVAALVIERTKAAQADGRRLEVQTQAAGPAAGNVVVDFLFGNLAELEKLRARNVTDPAARLWTLVAQPAQIEVFETLVAFQAR